MSLLRVDLVDPRVCSWESTRGVGVEDQMMIDDDERQVENNQDDKMTRIGFRVGPSGKLPGYLPAYLSIALL